MEKDFSLLQNVKNVGPTQPPSIVMGSLAPEQNGRDVRPTAYFCLVPGFRMSGAVLLRPLYAFMVWTGTTVQFID